MASVTKNGQVIFGVDESDQNWRYFRNNISLSSYRSYYNNLNSILGAEVGDITSRDQIINPYELVDASLYKNNAKGRALYNQDLARAQAYMSQQEAAYEEWYNSESQQVQRQREAGLNPDLQGIDPSSASSASVPEVSPLADVPSNGEIASNVISGVTSIFSIVGSLASLPSSIGASNASKGLLQSQKDAQDIANIQAVEKGWYGAISNNLSDSIESARKAGQTFDFDTWFADESNMSGIFESFVPNGVTRDDARYGAAWNRVRKNIQSAKRDAYDINSAATTNQQKFVQNLSSGYYDDDILISEALTSPLMDAQYKLDVLLADYKIVQTQFDKEVTSNLDAASHASALNTKALSDKAEYDYKTDYFKNVASKEDAARVLAMEIDNIINGATSDVVGNYRAIYNNPKSSGIVKQRAAAVCLGRNSISKELIALLATELPADLFTTEVSSSDDESSSNPFTDPNFSFGNRWINLGGVSFGD